MGQVDISLQPPITLYNPGPLAYTATGNSGPIALQGAARLFLSALWTAVTGTTPSLTLSLDQQDANGNWITGIASLTAATAAGQGFTSIGAGLSVTHQPMSIVRIVWTVTGTTPSFTGTISLLGR